MSDNKSINILIDKPVIIDAWQQDDTYDGVFPKGARDKSVYFSPGAPGESSIKPECRYLFKLSRNRFPWQYWMEIIAYRVGLLIGVTVPPAHIGISTHYTPGQTTYGALIEWFFDGKIDAYIEGGQFMMQLIENYDRDRGRQHNFKSFSIIFSQYPKFIAHWAGVFTLDALIGNTDRHQDNWGLVIENGKVQTHNKAIRFSPAFDNGTALGYEILERNIEKYEDAAYFQRYLTNPQKARHHMRWSLEEDTPTNFYDFLKQFVLEFPEAKGIIATRHVGFTEDQLAELLEPLVSAVAEPVYALSRRRLEFVIKIIIQRKRLIEQALEL